VLDQADQTISSQSPLNSLIVSYLRNYKESKVIVSVRY